MSSLLNMKATFVEPLPLTWKWSFVFDRGIFHVSSWMVVLSVCFGISENSSRPSQTEKTQRFYQELEAINLEERTRKKGFQSLRIVDPEFCFNYPFWISWQVQGTCRVARLQTDALLVRTMTFSFFLETMFIISNEWFIIKCENATVTEKLSYPQAYCYQERCNSWFHPHPR